MHLINSQDKSIMWQKYFLCTNVQHKVKKKADEYKWCIKPHSKEISGAPEIPFNTNVFPTCSSAAIETQNLHIPLTAELHTQTQTGHIPSQK